MYNTFIVTKVIANETHMVVPYENFMIMTYEFYDDTQPFDYLAVSYVFFLSWCDVNCMAIDVFIG